MTVGREEGREGGREGGKEGEGGREGRREGEREREREARLQKPLWCWLGTSLPGYAWGCTHTPNTHPVI